MRVKHRKLLAAYSFVLPYYFAFVVFMLFPVMASIVISLYKWPMIGSPQWLRFGNYVKLSQSAEFIHALKNTFVYTMLFIPFTAVMAFFVALILNNPSVRGKTFFRALLFIPVISAYVIVGIIWKNIYEGEYGVLNFLLQLLRLPKIAWLGNTRTALPSIAVVSIWKAYAFNMVIFLAGLQAVPVSCLEAAQIDGASRSTRLIHITIPLLYPVIAVVLILLTIDSLQVFDLIFVMTAAGPANATLTIGYIIYRTAFRRFELGYAAAMSVILFLITFVISLIILFRLHSKTE